MVVTIKDIAKRYGTTPSTVSRALRDASTIAVDTRKQIKEMARDMGYRPNHAGKLLRAGKTNTIGVVLPSFENPYSIEFLKQVKIRCAAEGYQVALVDFGMDSKQEKACLEQMLERRCDGIICYLSRFQELLGEFWDARIPCVVVGISEDTGDLKIDGIVEDFQTGYQKAVDHLVKLGHREIVHISCAPSEGKLGQPACPEFERSLAKHGIVAGPNNLMSHYTGNVLEDGVYMAGEMLRLNPKATAVIGANDLFAAGFVRGLTASKIRVPEDISIIGVDNSWVSEYWQTPMTSIDQKSSEQVRGAMDILFHRLNTRQWDEPRHILVSTDLVVRESTGPVRQHSL